MNQSTVIYFRRLQKLLTDCDNPKDAFKIATWVAENTQFNKRQRTELVALCKEKSGYKFYSCEGCSETFKSRADLDAHLFNNKYYKP